MFSTLHALTATFPHPPPAVLLDTMLASNILTSVFVVATVATSHRQPDTMAMNPAPPGWHSDPSCVFVPDWNSTTFCTASSFLSTPGLPILESKDLRSWELVGHAFDAAPDDTGVRHITRAERRHLGGYHSIPRGHLLHRHGLHLHERSRRTFQVRSDLQFNKPLRRRRMERPFEV